MWLTGCILYVCIIIMIGMIYQNITETCIRGYLYVEILFYRYMNLVERLPAYGIHYYEVRDRSNLPWYLGLSYRGIAQYDFLDKRKPRRVFLWKQLENLYFRERKFSIEVHDPKR